MMTETDESDVLKHVKPRRGQIAGAKALIQSRIGPKAIKPLSETIFEVAGWSVMTIIVLALATGGALIAERIYHPLYYAVTGAMILYYAFQVATRLEERATERDDSVMLSALAKVSPMIENMSAKDPDVANFLKLSKKRKGEFDTTFRAALAQLVMIERERSEIDVSALSKREIREMDEATDKAAGKVLSALRARDIKAMTSPTAIAAPVDVREYASRLDQITDGTMPTTRRNRTGHVETDRLISLAESALAEEPDLTDGSGNSVSSLVREHLPKLVTVHAKAISHAGPIERAQADETLKQALAKASSSIHEALHLFQKRRSDALSTQARFIDMRHTPTGELN